MRSSRLSLRLALSFIFAVLLFVLPARAIPEQTGALEIVINNMDRYRYVVFVDRHMAGALEGYGTNAQQVWRRLPIKESGRLRIENLAPGSHDVSIEAHQDSDSLAARSREEFLTLFHPLNFQITIDGHTRHEIDARNAFQSRVVAGQALEYDKKEEWQSFVNEIDGKAIEVKIQYYRKKNKMGRAERRLNAKGKWDKASKYVYYVNAGVMVDGQILHTEKATPTGGRVEFQYWDFGRGKWFDDAFNDDTLSDERQILFAETLPLPDQYEVRIAGNGNIIRFSILKPPADVEFHPSE